MDRTPLIYNCFKFVLLAYMQMCFPVAVSHTFIRYFPWKRSTQKWYAWINFILAIISILYTYTQSKQISSWIESLFKAWSHNIRKILRKILQYESIIFIFLFFEKISSGRSFRFEPSIKQSILSVNICYILCSYHSKIIYVMSHP